MFFGCCSSSKNRAAPATLRRPASAQIGENFVTVISNPRFMLFLLIFSGYWVVYWQEFIVLPLYITTYIDPKANTERILVTDPDRSDRCRCWSACSPTNTGISSHHAGDSHLRLGMSHSDRASFGSDGCADAICGLGWRDHPVTAILRIYFAARPRRQQGTYMGFAFLPIGIGSLVGGWFGGRLIHHFGEVTHQPKGLVGRDCRGMLRPLLWIYDRKLRDRQSKNLSVVKLSTVHA